MKSSPNSLRAARRSASCLVNFLLTLSFADLVRDGIPFG